MSIRFSRRLLLAGLTVADAAVDSPLAAVVTDAAPVDGSSRPAGSLHIVVPKGALIANVATGVATNAHGSADKMFFAAAPGNTR